MPAPRTARFPTKKQATLTGISVALALVFLIAAPGPTAADSLPASYVDIRIEQDTIDLTLVVRVVDAAHDMEITPPEKLLDPSVLSFRGDALIWLLRSRLRLAAGDRFLGDGTWSKVEALPDRQFLRLHARYAVGGEAGTVTVKATLFPYDPMHKTFLKFYEGDKVTAEGVLDRSHTQFEYFAGAHP